MPISRQESVLEQAMLFTERTLYGDFTTAYLALLSSVMSRGKPANAQNPRGSARELTNVVYSLKGLDTPANWHVDFKKTGYPERTEVYESYAKRELEWYQSGSLDAATAPSKFWSKLADDQGKIVSNYGHMMLHWPGYPQDRTAVQTAADILVADPCSRQAVLHYSQPKHYLGLKDTPCTVSASVMIRDGKLNMTTFQRSCDCVKGLGFDTAWNCWLMSYLRDLLAAKGVVAELGTFTHVIVSLHIYDVDMDLVCKILAKG